MKMKLNEILKLCSDLPWKTCTTFVKESIYGKIIVIAVAGSVTTGVVVSSSNPMNKALTKENYKAVVDEIRKESSAEDFQKVQGIMLMMTFAGVLSEDKKFNEVVKGKSFNDLIDHVKNRDKEREEEAKAAEKKASQGVGEREKYLEISHWNKTTQTDAYSINKKVVIEVTARNKKSEAIDAFQGKVYIYDKLDNKLADLSVKATKGLAGKSKDKVVWIFSTIDFQNNMKEVYRSPASHLKFKFKSTKILLKNGKSF